jgi:hypothetical protein
VKTTATVAGTHIRYDVPTKCNIVKAIVTSSYLTKAAQDSHIKSLADRLNVNPLTIKMWVSKYHNTYDMGRKLPQGTMSHTFVVLEDTAIPKAYSTLSKIRKQVVTLRNNLETSTVSGTAADDVRSSKTPNQILKQLVEETKAK